MSSLKQEKQERTRKKQNETGNEQDETNENKKNNNPVILYEAKRQVFSLVQQGWNYRKISQISFQIESLGLKRFSISEISKIKNEFTVDNHIESIKNSSNTKGDKTRIFQLIKNGARLEDIVISTGLEPSFVKEAHNEFMELRNLSPSLIDEIHDILMEKGIQYHDDPESLKQVIEKLVSAYRFLNSLSYTCVICKKPISLSPHGSNNNWAEDLSYAIHHLSKDRGHSGCIDSN